MKEKNFKFKVKTSGDRDEVEQAKKNRDTSAKDIENFFEGFVKRSRIIKTKDFGEGFTVSLSPCTLENLVEAELLIRGSNPGIPVDTMVRLRACAILSYAITQIGDTVIEKSKNTDEDNRIRRFGLYQQLLSLPPALITEIYDFYLKTVDEQDKMFSSASKMGEEIENF